jgi:hypothetical protein
MASTSKGISQVGIYPIFTLQYSSATVYQVSYHIQSLVFLKWQLDLSLLAGLASGVAERPHAVRPRRRRRLRAESEKVGPEVGPTSAFSSCIPTEVHGPACIVQPDTFPAQRAP